MTLNQDCIRDVLLQVEAAGLADHITEKTLHAKLPAYTEDEICYACYMLGDAGYLEIEKDRYIRHVGVTVHGMTYKGHGFLDQIRDATVWDKVKKAGKSAWNSGPDSTGRYRKGCYCGEAVWLMSRSTSPSAMKSSRTCAPQ